MSFKFFTEKKIVFIYILLSSILPLIAFIYEFNFNSGWYFFSLYGHLFIYPVLFGLWLLIFLSKTLKLLTSLQQTKKFIKKLGLLIFFVWLGEVYFEFSEKIAIFEVPNSSLSLELEPQDKSKKPITLLAYIKQPTPDKNNYGLAFEKIVSKNTFSELPYLSAPQITYIVSFSIQLLFYLVVLLSFVWSLRLYLSNDKSYLRKRKDIVSNLLLMIIFVVPWFAWRMSFEHYRADIYPSLNVQNPIAILAVPFIVIGVYLAIISWNQVGARLQSIISLGSSLGIGGILIKDNWLANAFPKAPNIEYYLLVLLVITILIFPLTIKDNKKT